MSVEVKNEKFQCRRCRNVLFEWNDLTEDHVIKDSCSLWFLKDDDMLPWVSTLVNESGWTQGKLYCPQCEARIGAFDFLHTIACGCEVETIPAIYCVRSKVDHMRKITQQLNVLTHKKDESNDVVEHKSTTGGVQNNSTIDGESSKSNQDNNEVTEAIEMIDFNKKHDKQLSQEDFFSSDSQESGDEGDEDLHNASLDNYEILDSVNLETQDDVTTAELEATTMSNIFEPSINEEMLVNETMLLENEAGNVEDPSVEDFFIKMIVSDALSIEDSVEEEVRKDIIFDSAFMKDGSSSTALSPAARLSSSSTTITSEEVDTAFLFESNNFDEIIPCSSHDVFVEDELEVSVVDENHEMLNECFDTKPNKGNAGSTSLFRNPSFDPDICNDDIFFKETSILQSEFNFNRRTKYTSHRPTSNILQCLRCRPSYNSFAERADNRRKHQSNCCNKRRMNQPRFDEFVNISYDGNRREGYVHTLPPCSCCNASRNYSPRKHMFDEQTYGCMGNDGREIYDDLISVRQDMINLQGLIETTTERHSGRRHKRECRRRRMNERLSHDSDHEHDYHDNEHEEEADVHNEGSEYEIPDNFQCPVCLDILYEPHSTACAHVFCSPCLRQLNKTSNRKPLCPLCRQRVYNVEQCTDLQDDIKRLYPEVHRQRSLGESRRPLNQFPLPSLTSVRFEQERSNVSNRFIHCLYVARTCLIVMFMLLTYLLNGEGRATEQRRYTRHMRIFFYILMGLVFTFVGAVIGLLFAFYAYDLLKFLIGFLIFYAIVAKYAVSFISD